MDEATRAIIKKELVEILLVQAGLPEREREQFAEATVSRLEAALALPTEE